MKFRAVRTLHRRQWVPQELADVFAFFERPENLAELTPPWLALCVVTPGSMTMRSGLVIDYTVRVLGRRFRPEDGGAVIEDVVVYEAPLGPLGALPTC